jgi:hypothetical protein
MQKAAASNTALLALLEGATVVRLSPTLVRLSAIGQTATALAVISHVSGQGPITHMRLTDVIGGERDAV